MMYRKLNEAEKTAFNPIRGGVDPVACQVGLGKYKGFWGPFIQ